jgi:hypothetical protein
MKKHNQSSQQKKKTVKKYTSPILKKFGRIADLTSGGTTGTGDGQSGRRPA